MAQRGIREFDAKHLLSTHWNQTIGKSLKFPSQSVLITDSDDLQKQSKKHKWLNNTPLVVKPDMLFGKRGKNDLVLFKTKTPGDVTLADAKKWISSKTNSDITLLDGTKGDLRYFIVEPFIPHEDNEEYYVSFEAGKEDDVIHFSECGGVDIEDNWDSVSHITIPLNLTDSAIKSHIETGFPKDLKNRDKLLILIVGLYQFFRDLHFTYFEINPFVLKGDTIYILDTVAKIDDTASFLMHDKWGELSFPNSFGQAALSEEEKEISKIDEKSGASLKLTILNPTGRVWTLVAGGGASVVYADTIADTWGVEELANYGEYSGNPSAQETYQYASTVIDLMTREKDKDNRKKVLLIGGAIANFTDVAKTFSGIIKAFEDHADKMRDMGIKIYVRRGGPNYEIGLKNIRNAARKELNLPIEVYGPETHITDIVRISYEDAAQ